MCLGEREPSLLEMEMETHSDQWVHFSVSSKHDSTCRT